MDEYTETELQQAHDALSDAEKLREAGGTEDAIINRLYYACFHATQAVLHTRGFDPQTHSGVLTLFGKEIVSAGDATREDGRFLNELQSYRLAADYEHTSIDVNVDELFEQASAFVSDMELLC